MRKILIIGGGAAGLFAALIAAQNGMQVEIFEQNDKLGKKLLITGKGRCNLTNACDISELFSNVITNSKFMYSSLYGFSNTDAYTFFEELGVPLKVERGNRVFPCSDRSMDIVLAMQKKLKELKVKIRLKSRVTSFLVEQNAFKGIQLQEGSKHYGDACIIATGGLSYPTTGSTGDGYRLLEKLGHTVSPCLPSLVPMEIKEDFVKDLQGLSLRNIQIQISSGKKKLYEQFGELLFTHYGVSGPLILSASRFVGEELIKHPLQLSIDLKPALSMEQLDLRLLREFDANSNKQFKNVIQSLFPAKLIPVILSCSKISTEKKIHQITREERQSFLHLIKHFDMEITKLRGYNEAVITRGGIKVQEVNPSTMESKLVQNLYIVGELLDIDALTGGYNLQVAWSTAYAAGIASSTL